MHPSPENGATPDPHGSYASGVTAIDGLCTVALDIAACRCPHLHRSVTYR